MLYCENCYFAFQEELKRCPLCGSKRVRPAKDEDFCLVADEREAKSDNLRECFGSAGIPCSAMPYGNGLRSYFALPMDRYRLYVPFAYREQAVEIISASDRLQTETLREQLLKNAGRFFVQQKTEKKIRRKYKIPPDTDLIGLCVQIVKSAEKISDQGWTGSLNGGHYIFCASGEQSLMVNSETYEILSLTSARRYGKDRDTGGKESRRGREKE